MASGAPETSTSTAPQKQVPVCVSVILSLSPQIYDRPVLPSSGRLGNSSNESEICPKHLRKIDSIAVARVDNHSCVRWRRFSNRLAKRRNVSLGSSFPLSATPLFRQLSGVEQTKLGESGHRGLSVSFTGALHKDQRPAFSQSAHICRTVILFFGGVRYVDHPRIPEWPGEFRAQLGVPSWLSENDACH